MRQQSIGGNNRRNNRSVLWCLLLLSIATGVKGQEPQTARPKLILGIVVDQMKPDYIGKYWEDFTEGGWKRLMRQGTVFHNAHYNYIPTYTAPGHASIATGAYPNMHGIIANTWYRKGVDAMMYCTEHTEKEYPKVDSDTRSYSPKALLTPTFSGELEIFSSEQSQTYAVSIKDRSAIFSLGHFGDGAFWLDQASGNMRTSKYYSDTLPYWVERFNAQQLSKQYMSTPWIPLKHYTNESTPDDNTFEHLFPWENNSAFPHDFSLGENTERSATYFLKETPMGNSYLTDFAMALLEGTSIGLDEVTDMLTVSYSCTDIIGHRYGTESLEIRDTYVRLDRDIARLLDVLDKRFGMENILVYLTADHGAAYNTQFLQEKQIPSGNFDVAALHVRLDSILNQEGFPNAIASIYNQQIHIRAGVEDKESVLHILRRELMSLEGMYDVFSPADIASGASDLARHLRNGYHPQRSGDLLYTLLPGWMEYKSVGTTHGTSFSYDTHVPLIWYGWNMPPLDVSERVDIIDIVPTLSNTVGMGTPSGSGGKSLLQYIRSGQK